MEWFTWMRIREKIVSSCIYICNLRLGSTSICCQMLTVIKRVDVTHYFFKQCTCAPYRGLKFLSKNTYMYISATMYVSLHNIAICEFACIGLKNNFAKLVNFRFSKLCFLTWYFQPYISQIGISNSLSGFQIFKVPC